MVWLVLKKKLRQQNCETNKQLMQIAPKGCFLRLFNYYNMKYHSTQMQMHTLQTIYKTNNV